MDEEKGKKRWFVRILRSFAKWVLLPVAVLSASILVVVIGWSYYQDYRDRDLSIAKIWPTHDIPFNRSRASLKTSWRHGVLYYQFAVAPISEDFLRKTRARSSSDQLVFFLDFEDSSEFKLESRKIDINNMTRMVNEKGDTEGLAINDSTSFSRDAYKASAQWSVRWADAFDEIAKEMKEDERLRLLREKLPLLNACLADALNSYNANWKSSCGPGRSFKCNLPPDVSDRLDTYHKGLKEDCFKRYPQR